MCSPRARPNLGLQTYGPASPSGNVIRETPKPESRVKSRRKESLDLDRRPLLRQLRSNFPIYPLVPFSDVLLTFELFLLLLFRAW